LSAEYIVLVPYESDQLETLAALMLNRHQRDLPDLSAHVVLFPHPGAIPRFRRVLLDAAQRAGHGGVLAPWCGTLDGWLQSQAYDSGDLVDEPERDLLLLEALQSHPALRSRYGTWPLVDSLLALFDELNAHYPALPPDVEEFLSNLTDSYGLREPIAPLRGEANLVHTLWSGWNAHLQNQRLQDRALRRRLMLTNSQLPDDATHHIYMVGVVELSGTEAGWLKTLRQGRRVTVLLHGGVRASGYHPDGAIRRCYEMLGVPVPSLPEPGAPYSRFIESVYADDTNMGARARAFAAAVADEPVTERLRVYAAADFEQEARAVDLAVRRWQAEGVDGIGIVTSDRKLARRVRALLERANLRLRDAAGWALSTTSAATAVMRWIECVEQDFAHAPLLDFLKSPFVALGFAKTELEDIVHCFEEQIVRAHNVSSGLDRYRRIIRSSRAALTVRDTLLLEMLDRLANAAAPLSRRLNARTLRPASDHLTALYRSLEKSDVVTGLSADAAGSQLLAVLRPNRGTLGMRGARLTWSEFHHWLRRELERRRFRPPLPEDGIDLLDLAESRCRRFEALVIAGCTRENLPGVLAYSPFFNDGVRASLGLPTREDRLLAPLHDFRRLLEAAPRVLLTWRLTEDNEPVPASPWTERLVAFHRLAYGTVPEDTELRRLLAARETALYRRDGTPRPCGATMPTPSLPSTRIPSTLSAGAHQRLLDCPYQFYVVDGLGLRSLDEVRDEMQKADYGENVHRILHAFHTGVKGLPGPWRGGAIEPSNRAEAVELLRELGRRVFGYDTDRRLNTRGWHLRWENFVETYIDWQAQRARDWHVEATEKTLERELTVGHRSLTLKGRADRIDRGPDGLAIIDYKTGSIPTTETVLSGEHAQLPFYALLHPGATTEVLYAKFERDAIKTNVDVKDEALSNLVRMLERRLRTLIESIDHGAPLTAWGDPETCKYCRYEGLCRKEMWLMPGSTPLGEPDRLTKTQAGEQLDLFPGSKK
jgi:ATP-dependent helicase/nuclease subunit B